MRKINVAILTPETAGILVFGQQPILVGRIVHRERSHGRATTMQASLTCSLNWEQIRAEQIHQLGPRPIFYFFPLSTYNYVLPPCPMLFSGLIYIYIYY